MVCPCCSQSQELAVASPEPVKTKRGSRMHADWYPSQRAIDVMKQEFPQLDAYWFRYQHKCFIDYWISAPGQKGVKVDWDATWRNWIRRAAVGYSRANTLSTVDNKVSGWLELGL